MPPIRKIAITTGGGDAPGLNAVIRAAVVSSLQRGWECWGIREGYNGLLFPERFGGDGLIALDRESVRGITHLGGTIIGTTNQGDPLDYPIEKPDGTFVKIDLSDKLIKAFRARQLDALIAVGGDGSMHIAHAISQRGIRLVGVPKTIDNDLDGTVVTFGFQTAVSFAVSCLDRLHSTAEAHRRIMVVEVMGRYAGWIALHAGIAGTADAILIPEIPYDIHRVAEKINERRQKGRPFSIVVVAEGAQPVSDVATADVTRTGSASRLGGVSVDVAAQLAELTGQEVRTVILGHLLRGGSPTAYDRLIALRFGAAAVRALEQGQSGVMVSLDPPDVRFVPLEEATKRMKSVPVEGDTLLTGRDMGISFGD